MGTKFNMGHISTQILLGAVLMITASANTLGLQSIAGSSLDREMSGSAGYLLISPVGIESPINAQRKPSCTPGFSCTAIQKVTNRVSKKEAVRFALLIGASSIK